MMNNTDTIKLIQDCIENSESKLDSAQILSDKGKFGDAISWIIIAYEEAGKADFLTNKFTNKEPILDTDWNSLTKGGSHTKKLIMYYENRKKTFESMSDPDFLTLQNHYKKILPVTHSRYQIMEELEKTIYFFKKLNVLKKKITYVDNQPQNKQFTENELTAIFLLLNFETRKSISLTKFGLKSISFIPTGNDSEDLKRIDKFDSFKKMLELKKESILPQNVKQFALAKLLLQNL